MKRVTVCVLGMLAAAAVVMGAGAEPTVEELQATAAKQALRVKSLEAQVRVLTRENERLRKRVAYLETPEAERGQVATAERDDGDVSEQTGQLKPVLSGKDLPSVAQWEGWTALQREKWLTGARERRIRIRATVRSVKAVGEGTYRISMGSSRTRRQKNSVLECRVSTTDGRAVALRKGTELTVTGRIVGLTIGGWRARPGRPSRTTQGGVEIERILVHERYDLTLEDGRF